MKRVQKKEIASVLSAKNKGVRLVLIAGRFKDVGNVNTVFLVVFAPRRYS